MVAAGHTERAWGCNAGLPRSACLAGASRFKALLLNHRRRLPDAIVLVNAPHTLLSADNRRWAARACRRSAARPDLVSLECELDEQGDKTGCFSASREQGGGRSHAHVQFTGVLLCSLCLPRGLLASSKRSPRKLSTRVDREKEATWSGSEVPGSTYSNPSMPPAL